MDILLSLGKIADFIIDSLTERDRNIYIDDKESNIFKEKGILLAKAKLLKNSDIMTLGNSEGIPVFVQQDIDNQKQLLAEIKESISHLDGRELVNEMKGLLQWLIDTINIIKEKKYPSVLSIGPISFYLDNSKIVKLTMGQDLQTKKTIKDHEDLKINGLTGKTISSLPVLYALTERYNEVGKNNEFEIDFNNKEVRKTINSWDCAFTLHRQDKQGKKTTRRREIASIVSVLNIFLERESIGIEINALKGRGKNMRKNENEPIMYIVKVAK